jgi:phosphoglycerate dehydrogenase-like enzyme
MNMAERSPGNPSETKLLICVNNPAPLWNPPADAAQLMRARFPELRATHLPNFDGLERELADTDIFMGISLTASQLMLAPKLRWIQAVTAGVAQFMYPELRERGIVLTNATSVHCVPIAQHILGTIIALARRFPDSFRYQRQGIWAMNELLAAPIKPRELRDQVLLFIGFGAIGQETARLVRPLEMRVWALTHSGRSGSGLAERVFQSSQLHEALRQADFVVVAAPATPETRNMLGEREFALMKPSAYLINVARGTLLDEPALISALERNRIAGAALDVTVKEPLSPDSPLWKMNNVFITPHVSGATENTWDREEELMAENLKRWFAGSELLNRVDLTRGY